MTIPQKRSQKFRHQAHWVAKYLSQLALCGACLSACGAEAEPEGDEVVVGLLLPFTGESSATAQNFERAALMAADRVNAAGGVQGKRVVIVSKDTHSDLARAKESARELVDRGASIVLGPESADMAGELFVFFTKHDIPFVSPLVGDAGAAFACETPWFRLAPSAKALGEALAKQLFAQDVRSLSVLSASGTYDVALGKAAAKRFDSLGGSVVFETTLPPGVQSYASEAAAALDSDAEALLLAAPPRAAALVVNESQVLQSALPRWSLSPLLKTELFTLNVDPKALQGAVGVAPKVFHQSDDFPRAFAERWLGDVPLEGAYFYYDAVSLAAFALAVVEVDAEGRPEAASLRAKIQQVAAPTGEAAGWDELARGLQRLADGQDMYYSGLTGPLLLDGCGARRLGVTSTWTVEDGSIVTDD